MPRVVGCDPGTSSLDLVLLADGRIEATRVILPGDDEDALRDTLLGWQPLDLIAAPSGYGLPLVGSGGFTDRHLALMTLVRPDDRDRAVGVRGFKRYVRSLVDSGLPAVFLPGGIHLPTVPAHRRLNTIDMATPDKVAVGALALRHHADRHGVRLQDSTFAVVEVGSAFTAVLVVEGGKLVDASAGTRGPIGLAGAGAWDGEVAYALSPITKDDLFRGGVGSLGAVGLDALRESLVRHVGGLRAVTPFAHVYLSGKGLDRPEVAAVVRAAASPFGLVEDLPACPVKHSALGAALLADGLAGGRHADLVESLELRRASGTIWDHLRIRPGGPVPDWAAG